MRLRGRVKPAARVLAQRELFFVHPGHFYSPILAVSDRARVGDRLASPPRDLPGIDLREAEQVRLLGELAAYYDDLPFTAEAVPGLRYHYDNDSYRYSDGIFFSAVLRHFRSRRLIEVGSGYSSALALDINELFLAGRCELTFVEPFPDALRAVASDADLDRRLRQEPLQSVPLDLFAELGPGDVLFIDSTHVSRAGSDVSYVLFEILPSLRPGVLVHVHDIFHPFEYPAAWIGEGRSWNEAYALRAFLTFNPEYKILLFNTFLEAFHREWFETHMPMCLEDTGGSIWLERLG